MPLVEVETIQINHSWHRIITLNDPDIRNPLSIEMMRGLMKAILQSPNERIILIGEGKLFCAGLHEGELRDFLKTDGSHARMLESFVILLQLLAAHPSYTASIVTGKTMAGGVALACCADVVVMPREDATLGVPGKLRKDPYRKLARILIPILNRRRNASRRTTKTWLGKTFDAGAAKEYELATHISTQTTRESLIREASEQMQQLANRVDYSSSPPRIDPRVMIAVYKAVKNALAPRAVKLLRQHHRG